MEEITEAGAPAGRKDYVVWDAPPVDAMDPSLGRQSTLHEATRLARFLMERGVRLIVFCPVSLPFSRTLNALWLIFCHRSANLAS